MRYNISILIGHDPIASALYRPIRSRQNIVRPQSVFRHSFDGSGGLKTDFNIYALALFEKTRIPMTWPVSSKIRLPNAIFSSPYHWLLDMNE